MHLRYGPEYWDYDTGLLYKSVSRFEFIANAIWSLHLNTIPIDYSKVKINDIIPQYEDPIAFQGPYSFYYMTNLKALPFSYRFKKVKFDDITKYLNSKYVYSGEVNSGIPTQNGSFIKKQFKSVVDENGMAGCSSGL
ncbi:hypothetical protein [Caldicellulosiruptor acetigenus]|uniref:Uncharacterized protein n=1 Tax=Caldicellulosiruptor acetigenus 6A TaxID=632516 RepID=G2PU50_9FIRM|nr:hypothetical protein [Caldicellulosiruptor acetigenus]AEM74401.1 hypothetical protein Calla_1819 [Caldicellulosiruptor acetigenus 6A]